VLFAASRAPDATTCCCCLQEKHKVAAQVQNYAAASHCSVYTPEVHLQVSHPLLLLLLLLPQTRQIRYISNNTATLPHCSM
jgi:hypothetical protein